MKERIDILLVERRLVESRTKAQWLITKGYVTVNGKKITKPGKKVENSHDIQLEKRFPYVSRGGLKLEAAINEFSIFIEDKICIDIGASVGGFTDCLLQHGAKKVYAIDIAYDILHPSLRCEKVEDKVIPLLGIDARGMIPIPEKADICTIDVTFASLRSILPNIKNIMKADGNIIALIKPLFETEFHTEQKSNIFQDTSLLYQILVDLIDWCEKSRFKPIGIMRSPLIGQEKSTEFILYLRTVGTDKTFNYRETIRNLLI